MNYEMMMAKPLMHIGSVAIIILQYQEQGLLKKESPVATVGVLFGPIIVRSMFERALGGIYPSAGPAGICGSFFTWEKHLRSFAQPGDGQNSPYPFSFAA